MPHIGIIRGFGEGEIATGYIIKIIKALRRRFRSDITYEEIKTGNVLQYGGELKKDAICAMKNCDAVFVGAFDGTANPLDYKLEDIAVALGSDVEYVCVTGFGKYASVDVRFASYFDGGATLRESRFDDDGATETRYCSMFAIKNIVKHVAHESENRRRRVAYVETDENEFCSKLFYAKFKERIFPNSNFTLIKFKVSEICYEMLYDPAQFDIVFASKTFSEMSSGIYQSVMQKEYAAYNKYGRQKPIYAPRPEFENSGTGDFVPSLNSYIIAFCDMLVHEFNMQKESVVLREALEEARKTNPSYSGCEKVVSDIVECMNKPLTKRFSRKKRKPKYII